MFQPNFRGSTGRGSQFIEAGGGENHFLSQPETRKQMLEAAIAFVEQHNPPD